MAIYIQNIFTCNVYTLSAHYLCRHYHLIAYYLHTHYVYTIYSLYIFYSLSIYSLSVSTHCLGVLPAPCVGSAGQGGAECSPGPRALGLHQVRGGVLQAARLWRIQI